MPKNLFPAPAPDDAPCAYELRITLTNGGVDEIGSSGSDHLGGYLRALSNHGLITREEFLRQVDALRLQHHSPTATHLHAFHRPFCQP